MARCSARSRRGAGCCRNQQPRAPRRHPFCVGVSARHLCLYEAGQRWPVLGFTALDWRACRPAFAGNKANLWWHRGSQSAGIGRDPSDLGGGRSRTAQSEFGTRRVSRVAAVARAVSNGRANELVPNLPARRVSYFFFILVNATCSFLPSTVR